MFIMIDEDDGGILFLYFIKVITRCITHRNILEYVSRLENKICGSTIDFIPIQIYEYVYDCATTN